MAVGILYITADTEVVGFTLFQGFQGIASIGISGYFQAFIGTLGTGFVLDHISGISIFVVGRITGPF